MKKVVFAVLFCAPALFAAERPLNTLTLSGGQMVTLEAGAKEPASIGSYALRLYSGANPKFPFDEFQSGVIALREGTLSPLEAKDIDGDKLPEVIVTAVSAGTGSYRNIDIYSTKSGNLTLVKQFQGVEPSTDVKTLY